MAVILQFPAVVEVREGWSMKRVMLMLVQAAVIVGCGICAGLMVWRWVARTETPVAAPVAVPVQGRGVWQLRQGGAAAPIRSYRALRRA